MQPFGPHRRIPFAAFVALVFGASSAAILAWTNPSPEDYKVHAGEQLVVFATRELCDGDGLTMMFRLLIRNCPELVASQQGALGDLAGRFTTRWNALVFSIYITRIGGQELLPGLRLPSAEVVTLAGAGRFFTLKTTTSIDGSP